MKRDDALEMTPLAERLGVLQAGRILAAVFVLGFPVLTGDAPDGLVPLAVGYLSLTVALEYVRRMARVRALRLVSGMLLLDGAFLACATTLTGGAGSPVLFLMLLDVLAVTLLVSYRSGVKIAIWCSLLLFLGQAALRSGWISGAKASTTRDAALGAAAFLAVALGAAAFSAVNERALRASRAQLAALVELDLEFARAPAARGVATALARSVGTELGFRRAGVVVQHPDGWISVVAEAGRGVVDIRPSGPATGTEVTGSGGSRLVRRLDPNGTLAGLLPDADSVVVVPLDVEGENLGVLAGEWGGGTKSRIPALTVDVVERAANNAALALRHRALLAEVERLATHDPLTGLANRRVFDEVLEREVNRSNRRTEPVTVIVLDFDQFKQVNDTLGHQAGDEVLRTGCSAIVGHTKNFDVVARLGGDEIAVVLPGCAHGDAAAIADRLRRVVREALESFGVTISAGWATCPDQGRDGPALLAAADAALYTSKRAGRDRTTAAPLLQGAMTSWAATFRRRS